MRRALVWGLRSSRRLTVDCVDVNAGMLVHQEHGGG